MLGARKILKRSLRNKSGSKLVVRLILHRQSKARLSIHPAIGVARLGNAGKPKAPDTGSDTIVPPHKNDWMLAPKKIGGLPIDPETNEAVKKMKNLRGEIKRQAAKFTVHKDGGTPLNFENDNVESVRWKVWVANKKSVWCEFARLSGDLMIEDNSYLKWSQVTDPNDPEKNVIFMRNKKNPKFPERDMKERFRFAINPGPREVSMGSPTAKFDNDGSYDDATFPQAALHENDLGKMYPEDLTTLGDMDMTTSGDVELFVRGAYGIWAGWECADIESYAGADGLFDDTCDGPVECFVKYRDNPVEESMAPAYVVCAQPNVAPEIDNINTWDDVVFDMAIRYLRADDRFVDDRFMFKMGREGYHPDIINDIAPIFKRMKNYQWVANIASMTAFASPTWDICDACVDDRREWFKMLRKATDFDTPVIDSPVDDDEHQQLYVEGGEELGDTYLAQPLNAGSGSVQPNVDSGVMSKFMSMTPTQYYMLYQWSEGYTRELKRREIPFPWLNAKDRVDIGNCVGYPSSPGIEVAWNVRNPSIYVPNDPYRINSVPISELEKKGLSHADEVADMRDECAEGSVEPGDLSKRMAVPWLADFTYCSVQSINFTHPDVNKWDQGQNGEANPKWKLPLYYAYWWPAASPYNIYVGARSPRDAALELTKDGMPIAMTGQNVEFQRGANGVKDVLQLWSHFGFIVNANKSSSGDAYPNFVESERNYADIKSYVTGVPKSCVMREANNAATKSKRHFAR